jgi:hypothetical protein
MNRINRIIKKAENLVIQIGAEINRTQGKRGIPIDIYMNDCLKYIEIINNLQNITKNQKRKAKKKLFDIYFTLQQYEGAERQTRKPFPKGKEISIEELGGSSLLSADAFKGGLGFSGVSNALFLQQSGPKHDDYWKPTPKSKVSTAPSSVHGWMMEDYEERRPLTLDEFHEEMDRQKREVLYEVRKLRETSNTNKGRVLIL